MYHNAVGVVYKLLARPRGEGGNPKRYVGRGSSEKVRTQKGPKIEDKTRKLVLCFHPKVVFLSSMELAFLM